MKIFKIIIIFLLIIFFSGCYNYQELNELAIVSAIGIDKNKAGYKMTIQVMNTKKNGSDTNAAGEQPKFVTYTLEGKTIQSILRDTVLKSPRRLYVNHMQLLVISEQLAKDGIHDILDWFARDSESRKQFYVIVSRNNNTADILNILTSLETLNSKKIYDNIETDSEFLGVSEQTTFENLLATYLGNKKELSLSTIKSVGNIAKGETSDNIKDSVPDAKTILMPMAIFKGDKMIGYLTKEESIGISFINNEIKKTIINYKCNPEKYISSEIIDVKTSLKADPQKAIVTIKIKGKANINEINCDWNLEDDKIIKKAEKMLDNKVEKIVENSVENIKLKYNSDIFGFEDLFYKTDYKYYKKIKANWYNDTFKNIKVIVKADINLIEKGNILKVIRK
ncbi:MAG: Ger(x)C family spore germination protein [Bacilli bacterium]